MSVETGEVTYSHQITNPSKAAIGLHDTPYVVMCDYNNKLCIGIKADIGFRISNVPFMAEYLIDDRFYGVDYRTLPDGSKVLDCYVTKETTTSIL